MTELVPVKKQPSVDLSPKQIPDITGLLKPDPQTNPDDIYARFYKRVSASANAAYSYPIVPPEPISDNAASEDTLQSLLDVYDIVDADDVESVANLIHAQESTEEGTPERDAADLALSLARIDPAYATNQKLMEITNFTTFLDKARAGNPDVGFFDDVRDFEELIRFVPDGVKGLWRAVAGQDYTHDEEQQAFHERIFRGDFNDLEPEEIWQLPELREDGALFGKDGSYTWGDNPDHDIAVLERVFFTAHEKKGVLSTNVAFGALEVTPLGLAPDAIRLARGTGSAILNTPAAFRNFRARRESARRLAEALAKDPQNPEVATNTTYAPSDIPPELLGELGEQARQELIRNESRAANIENNLNKGRQNVVDSVLLTGSTTGRTTMARWATKTQRRAGEEGELRPTLAILNDTGEAFTKREADARIHQLVEQTGLPRGDFRRVKVEGQRGRFHIEVAEPERMAQIHPTAKPADMNNDIFAGGVIMKTIRGFFQNPRQYMDSDLTPSMAEATENAAVEGIFSALKDSVGALVRDGANAQGVNNAVEIALLRDGYEDWMTPQVFERYFAEATGKAATAEDQALYQVYRQASDRAWRIKADADIRVMESMGGVRLHLLDEATSIGATGSIQARPIQLENVIPSKGAIAIREGQAVKLNPDEIAEAAKNGTVYEVFDDTLEGFRYVIDDGSAMVGRIRRQDIMQYVAGGRLDPSYAHYMKTTVNGESITLFGGNVRRELDQAANNIGALADLTRKYISLPRPALSSQSDSISNEIASLNISNISNAEDAVKYFEELTSSFDNQATKLEDVIDVIASLKGNKRPSVISSNHKSVDTGNIKIPDEEQRYGLMKKRLGFSRSSRRIRDINPSATRRHNYATPFDALSRDLQVATRRGAVAVDQHQMLDSFYHQYVAGTGRNVYEAIGDNGLGKAKYDQMVNDKVLPEGATERGVIAETNLAQQQIRHFMRYNHPVNEYATAISSALGDATYSASVRLNKINERFVGRPVRTVSEWLSNPEAFTPIETATAFVMDVKLGILNPQQAVIQASQTVVISAGRGTKFNGKAVASTPLQTLLNMPEDAARVFADKLDGISTFTPDQIMQLRSLFKEMAFDVYGRTHVMDDTARAAAGVRLGGGKSAWETVKAGIERGRLHSRVIFKQADMIPRVTAFLDGAADLVKRGADLSDDATKLELFNHTNKWVLGTTGVDTPVLLKRGLGGAIRPFAQFLSYTFRALGALFGKKGTNMFTGMERIGMLMGYLSLGGSRALPMLPVLLHWSLQKATDTTGGTNYQMLKEVLGEDLAVIAVAVDSGLIDAGLYSMLGVESSVGQRTSLDFTRQFYDTWVDNKYGTSAGSAFFGAVGSTTGQFFQTMDRLEYLSDIAYDESVSEWLVADAKIATRSLGSIITSVSAMERFIIGETLGELQSRSGGKLRDITRAENFVKNIVGAPLKDEEAFSNAIQNSDDRKELVKNVAADIARRRLSGYQLDLDGDQEGMVSQFSMAQVLANYLLSQGIPDTEIQRAVLDQYRRMGYEDVMSRVIRTDEEYRQRQQILARREESEE